MCSCSKKSDVTPQKVTVATFICSASRIHMGSGGDESLGEE